MSSLWRKRPAVLVALCLSGLSLFVLTRTNSLVPRASDGPGTAAAHPPQQSGVQRLLRGEGWGDIEGGGILASRAFRRLAGSTSPRAPPGHPYFTDDENESVILQAAEAEHEHGHTWHKPLHPIDGWDVVGVGLACIGLMIAAAGGIGGGGILVPLYILVLGFDPKHAIPLSNITIFGGAITNTVLNLSKRHPDADRPLVDWDLILVMEPLTIGGALVGSFINKVCAPAHKIALS